MTVKFKYKPPGSYITTCLSGFMLAALLGTATVKSVIEDGVFFYNIIIGLFALLGLLMGVLVSILSISVFNPNPLLIGEDFLEIPEGFKGKRRLMFSEIIHVYEFETEPSILIECFPDNVIIEEKWMRIKDFQKVRTLLHRKLKEHWEVVDLSKEE